MNNKNNILVYYEASEDGTFKEGWYSCNLLSQAGELCNDGEGQRFLMTELAKEGIEFKREAIYLDDEPVNPNIYDKEFFKKFKETSKDVSKE